MPEHTETEFRRRNKWGHRSRGQGQKFFMSRPGRWTPPLKYKKIRTGKTHDIEASHTPKLVERFEARVTIDQSLRDLKAYCQLADSIIDSYLDE